MLELAADRLAQVVAIVDDDGSIRPALVRLVESFGYQARSFVSAEALLTALDNLGPACVISDIQMPGINGHMLCNELRRRMPALPIMLMTAYPSLTVRERDAGDPVIEYATKPLDDRALEAWLLRSIGEPSSP